MQLEALKQHLAGREFHNNEEVEMAVHELLQMQEPGFQYNAIFKLVPRWDKLIRVSGIILKNYDS
jgi:hypothetical protein